MRATIIKTKKQTIVSGGVQNGRSPGVFNTIHAVWMVRVAHKKKVMVGHREIEFAGDAAYAKRQLRVSKPLRDEFVRGLCGEPKAEPVSLHLNGKLVFDFSDT